MPVEKVTRLCRSNSGPPADHSRRASRAAARGVPYGIRAQQGGPERDPAPALKPGHHERGQPDLQAPHSARGASAAECATSTNSETSTAPSTSPAAMRSTPSWLRSPHSRSPISTKPGWCSKTSRSSGPTRPTPRPSDSSSASSSRAFGSTKIASSQSSPSPRSYLSSSTAVPRRQGKRRGESTGATGVESGLYPSRHRDLDGCSALGRFLRADPDYADQLAER